MERRKLWADLDWKKYRVRRCYTLHHCELCHKDIRDGQQYYDGGYGRRAHLECASYGVIKESADAE